MKEEGRLTLTVNPFKRVIHPAKGANLLDAFLDEGVEVPVLCNRNGSCGKCRVVVKAPANAPVDVERLSLGELLISEGYRLACRTEIQGSGEVFIPLEHHEDLLESAYAGNELALMQSDGVFGRPRRTRALPRNRPDLLAAVDIGTTTLSGYLFDADGSLLSHASLFNPTALFGSDVITRMTRIQRGDRVFLQMRLSLLTAVKRMLTILCLKVGREGQVPAPCIDHIREIGICGNTIMQHVFLGINPVEIGLFPYQPVVREFMKTKLGDLEGFRETGLSQDAALYVAPSTSGFIGGDAVCGVIAAGLHATAEASLMIDLGTNGEMVLACNGRLFAASASAGPAFEGYSIACGMRASVGAISSVKINDAGDIAYTVIGGGRPRGLCGTGVVSAVAALLSIGALTPKGHIVPKAATSRISVNEFVIAPESETSTMSPIVLMDRDIEIIQQAKAAFSAAISCLLRSAGLPEKDLKKIFLAGAFGSRIEVENLAAIGLIPRGITHAEITPLGNAAGLGIARLLLSEEAEREAVETARRIVPIELSSQPDFEDTYIDALFFEDHEKRQGQ